MKKTKIIIPALGILLLSTAASVTGTVAWFSMNEKVSATTMSIKAKGEAGIAIAAWTGATQTTPPAESAFSDVAVASATANTNMIPTWTNDAEHWYHAKSVTTNNGAASALYGYEDVSSRSDIYLKNRFQIKATGEATNVYVKAINITGLNSTDFDSCIRVLVQTEEQTRVFAPVGNSTATETLSASLKVDDPETTDVNEEDAITENKTLTLVAVNTANSLVFTSLGSTPENVEIFMYYDGEDANCKSDEIPTAWVASSISVDFSNAI